MGGYYRSVVAGVGLMASGVTVFVYSLVTVISNFHGSCGGGNGSAYVYVRSCPKNEGFYIAGITIAVFMVIGGGALRLRGGSPPQSGRSRGPRHEGLGGLSEGSDSGIGSLGTTSASTSGGSSSGYTITPTPSFGSSPTPSAGASAGSSGQIAQLEKLDRLHKSGALTDEEFQREKTRVLGGG